MQAQTLQSIKQLTEDFFKKVGAMGEIEVRQGENSEVFIEVTFQEPQLYIGEKGQTLFEIQHILKGIIRKQVQSEEPLYISLDINEYKQNKEMYLRELARETANEAVLLKKTKELPPMVSAERRIIHVELAQRADIITESLGQDPDRRVVIKPRV